MNWAGNKEVSRPNYRVGLTLVLTNARKSGPKEETPQVNEAASKLTLKCSPFPLLPFEQVLVIARLRS